jgi:predicted Zn finger-like uncharacterized protein
MRLVCPNCEAKYEVPDDAIPDTGRDVQCTNCGHSWFQMRARPVAAPVVTGAPAGASPVAAPEVTATAAPAVAETPVVPEEVQPEAEDVAPVEGVETAPPQQPVAAETGAVHEAVIEQTPSAADSEDAPQTAVPLPDSIAAEAEAAAASEAAPVPDSIGAIEPEPVIEAVAETVADPGPVADATAEVEPQPLVESVDAAVSGDTADLAPEVDPKPIVDAAAEPDFEGTAADASPVADAEPAAEAQSDAQPAEPIVDTAEDTAAPAVASVAAASYAVDDSVLAILREEAEREANARRAEALESQTDLGLETAMPRKASALAEVEAKPSARRDLLPDVEEINSTLRPSEAQADADAPDFVEPPPQAPRGFRSGFLSLMTVAILAAALYLVAPRLADMIPALAGPLEAYVSLVDSLRLGLDGVMRSATVAISDG